MSCGEVVFLECITVNGPYTSKLDVPALNLVSRLLVCAPLFGMCVAISGFVHVSRLLVCAPLFGMCVSITGFVHELVATTQRCVCVYLNPSLPKNRTNFLRCG